ncbi:Phosphoribosylamine--glycine ligase [Candidatus Kinetoplastibacterium sorsogonicusi]|uniref:Phosphoribosylamine--glycine ligase n=1 Tax=Candidatus Kinetoplastidibacterium kentomonadis TaxID=1576550 RepID=A0A3Q8EY14_9PROT|nr:phosphoribosylamine--glycine ligase [Candidatus Kinetoplastibacterium sorsogonicusi]AWD32324.1 Phosphoribosylamine--glycine ligase [Candidatus Kinetoplastibacterium sorsogonicusi]
MKLLVIGSGGREHALVWRLSLSPRVKKIYVSPGNAGTANNDRIENISETDINDLINFAKIHNINMTIVGPEAPLAAGIVDNFREAGLKIFGPTKAAAQLESSKIFAKNFMIKHKIPTAKYACFENAVEAHNYIDNEEMPIVIKVDGLASGKGVVVAKSKEEAHDAINKFTNNFYSQNILIEEYLEGEEASFIVMSDGTNVLALATSQDHKRLLDEDLGPNTGGMGAYSPASIITPDIYNRIMRDVILPTINGMSKDGIPFTGFLYAGVMISNKLNNSAEKDIKILEFNCRIGDPEAQPIMMRMKTDLVDIFEHAINNSLDKAEIMWDRRTAVGVVIASKGYPDNPELGFPITGLPKDTDECVVFHSATKKLNNEIITSGGRVLCVTTLGDSIRIAREKAYDIISNIHFDGMQYRKDIGWRAMKSNKKNN